MGDSRAQLTWSLPVKLAAVPAEKEPPGAAAGRPQRAAGAAPSRRLERRCGGGASGASKRRRPRRVAAAGGRGGGGVPGTAPHLREGGRPRPRCAPETPRGAVLERRAARCSRRRARL